MIDAITSHAEESCNPIVACISDLYNRRCTPDICTARIRACISRGALANQPDAYHYPIHYAAALLHDATIVRMLVEEAGADINAKDRALETPLSLAVQIGQPVGFIAELIRLGADVHESAKALLYARERGDDELLELIISAGLDLEREAGVSEEIALIKYSEYLKRLAPSASSP